MDKPELKSNMAPLPFPVFSLYFSIPHIGVSAGNNAFQFHRIMGY